MSGFCSTSTWRTGAPRISRSSSASATVAASSGALAKPIPPALPRPPDRTCAFTATGPPSCPAIERASARLEATLPPGTGIPSLARSLFPWYSNSRAIRISSWLMSASQGIRRRRRRDGRKVAGGGRW